MVKDKVGRPPGELGVSKSLEGDFFLQCSDTVGWASGRASGLYKVGCWFVGGDDLTGALHDLQLRLSPPLPSSLAAIKPANPGSLGKMAVELVREG